MKTKFSLFLAAAVSCLSFTSTFAIEGLKLSIQSNDIVLIWPSATNETYLIQARASLDPNDAWATLTNFYPAASGTNWTSFVHSNAVCWPVGSGGGTNGGGNPPGFDSPSSPSSEDSWPPMPPLPWEWQPGNQGFNKYEVPNFLSGGGDFDPGGDGTNVCHAFYRVVRNGVHVSGLTNGMTLRGKLSFPIEIGLTNNSAVNGITAFNGDSPLVGTQVDTNDAGNWVLTWDTLKTANGGVSLHLMLSFDDAPAFTNPAVDVTVSNPISFPNYFANIFGNQMWIYAELAATNADYEIALYDESTNYLGSFVDSTTDGVVSFLWDLTDGYGHTFTNDNFTTEFYVTSTGAAATNKFAKEVYSTADDYIVAWFRFDGNPTNEKKLNDQTLDGVVNIVGQSHNLNPGNQVNGAEAFFVNDSQRKTNLLEYFGSPQYRNTYIFAHGSPSALGGKGLDGKDDPNTKITEYMVKKRTLNYLDIDTPFNVHPYRFVFLDGCDLGAGKFCEAFGIPAQTSSVAFFSTAGVRARAFLGFKKEIHWNPAGWDERATTLANFYFQWLSNNALDTCVSNALARAREPFDSSWVIYGAKDMKANSP